MSSIVYEALFVVSCCCCSFRSGALFHVIVADQVWGKFCIRRVKGLFVDAIMIPEHSTLFFLVETTKASITESINHCVQLTLTTGGL